MFKFKAIAPTRIDIAGGTIDLWPIHNILPVKATVNVAIGLNATVIVEQSEDHLFRLVSEDQNVSDSGSYKEICNSKKLQLLGLLLSAIWDEKLPAIKITTSAKSPAGAGLGGSSCLAVTTLKAIDAAKMHVTRSNHELSEEQLVRTAQDVESLVIHAPTGIQDYWGAVRGGLNIISYKFGDVHINTIHNFEDQIKDLKVLACYSGKSRASAINNWQIFKRVFDRDETLLQTLSELGVASEACAKAILSGNWNQAVEASLKEWQIRCRLWPDIETSETRAIDKAVKNAGAIFSRVCGAGGGGVMAIFAPKDALQKVSEAAKSAGGQILAAELGGPGLRCEKVS